MVLWRGGRGRCEKNGSFFFAKKRTGEKQRLLVYCLLSFLFVFFFLLATKMLNKFIIKFG